MNHRRAPCSRAPATLARVAFMALVALLMRAPAAGAQTAPFTPRQQEVLKAHGYRGDATDQALISYLRRLGFSPGEIARAYADTAQVGVGRANIPRAARFRALRLPRDKLADCLRSELSLTDWRNYEAVGGKTLHDVGVFLTVLGAASLIGGLVVIGLDRPSSHRDDEDDEGAAGLMALLLGTPLTLGGVLELAGGIPMWVIGHRRLKRWAPSGSLDRADHRTLERYRRRAVPAPGSRPRITLTPFLSPRAGGLALGIRF